MAVQLQVKLCDSYSPVILIKWPLNNKTIQIISWEVELGCQLKQTHSTVSKLNFGDETLHLAA